MSVISVIVPVFRVEDCLDRCIGSIVNQSYGNLEIILVNDGSPDGCGAICDRWAAADPRIKVIHKENGGVSSARNAGLAAASGAYITFVDSDDSLPRDALEIMYDRLIKDGSDLVIGKHIDVYEDGNVNGAYCHWMENRVLSKEALLRVMGQTRHFPVSACGKLYKKELFDGISYPPITYGEDLWVFPPVVDRCEQISVVGETVYFYHQRADSAFHNKNERTRYEELTAMLHMAKYLQSQGIAEGAITWVQLAIDRAVEMKRKRDGAALIKEWFDASERRRLLNGCSLKTRCKWLSLYIPAIYHAVRWFKRMVRWNENDRSD